MSRHLVACIFYKPPEKSDGVQEMNRGELKEKIEKGEFNGLPVCVDHDKTHPVGKVTEAFQEIDGSVYVRFQVSPETKQGKLAIEQLGKTLHELAPSFRVSMSSGQRTMIEVSLCRKSSYDNARFFEDAKGFTDIQKSPNKLQPEKK